MILAWLSRFNLEKARVNKRDQEYPAAREICQQSGMSVYEANYIQRRAKDKKSTRPKGTITSKHCEYTPVPSKRHYLLTFLSKQILPFGSA